MARFVLTRLALALGTLAIVSIVVFAVSDILPGNLGRTMLGPYASPAQVASIDRQLGLDHPLLVRYWDWLSSFLTGNWGHSYVLNEAVRPLVLGRLANSAYLAAFALGVIAPVAVGLGVVAAYHEGGALDRVISVSGMSLIALPEFVGGIVVLVIFSVYLGWFPVSSSVPSLSPLDVFRQFMLPSVPLMFVLFGYVSRMARAGTIEALASPYTRTAVLKGIPRRRVLLAHVLRNALLPTITVVAVQTGYLMGGLVVIETLFNYPGIGQLIYISATNHDVPVLEASVLLVAAIYVMTNLLADLGHAALGGQLRRPA